MKAKDAIKALLDVDSDTNVELRIIDTQMNEHTRSQLLSMGVDELAQMMAECLLNECLPASRQVELPKGVNRSTLNDIIKQVTEAMGRYEQ